MMREYVKEVCTFVLSAVILLCLVAPVMADKGGNGKSKGKKNSVQSSSQKQKSDNVDIYFDDRQRKIVSSYYNKQFKSGHCPPGLAKKNNGCMPPGQAKKWKRGSTLPLDEKYYDISEYLERELGKAPSGYRYVRVASDILLISTGTRMIMDAIEDLGDL